MFILYFSLPAMQRKGSKRKITTDANPNLSLSHYPTLTMAGQVSVRTIRGHPPTRQDALNEIPLIFENLIHMREA